MTVIDSYRETEGAKDLIARSIDQYRTVYKQWALMLNNKIIPH